MIPPRSMTWLRFSVLLASVPLPQLIIHACVSNFHISHPSVAQKYYLRNGRRGGKRGTRRRWGETEKESYIVKEAPVEESVGARAKGRAYEQLMSM